MLDTIAEYKKRFYAWAREAARSQYAAMWLTLVSFTEASFFLIPPDVLLVGILFSSVQRRRWKYWAAITTISSVAGGALGYLIGVGLFDVVGQPIIDFYNLQSEVARVGEWFNQHTFWAVFISAFTPIPYKVFTISAGLFQVPFFAFIIASVLGRGLRFFAIAYIMKVYGKRVLEGILRYFNIISVIVVVAITLLLFL